MSDPKAALPEHAMRVLLLEDSTLDAELVQEALNGIGRSVFVKRVVSAEEFRAAVSVEEWELILADYVLPAFDGLSALSFAREHCPNTPFIFVSGTLGEEIAVEALKLGATDYVVKQRLERLPATVLRALAEASERKQRRQAQADLHRLLEERTTLLHELDHRVKNNLQLLLSLVSIEMRQAGSDETRNTLWRMRERLQALGMAHRDLYDDREARLFDVAAFVRNLSDELISTMRGIDIAPEFEPAKIEVEAAKAAPIALLFNELIVNVLTHSYAHRTGKLKLQMKKKGGFLTFTLSDDAFSSEEKRNARASSMGTILRALSQQLDANVIWPEDDAKVLVRVTMPLDEADVWS